VIDPRNEKNTIFVPSSRPQRIRTKVKKTFPRLAMSRYYGGESHKHSLTAAGHWWFTPVILASQETEISRIHSSKPARTNTSQDPMLKILNTKRAGGVAQGVDPEFKPQYRKKKKKTYSLTANRSHLLSHSS
jgi:hypothetical protein